MIYDIAEIGIDHTYVKRIAKITTSVSWRDPA